MLHDSESKFNAEELLQGLIKHLVNNYDEHLEAEFTAHCYLYYEMKRPKTL